MSKALALARECVLFCADHRLNFDAAQALYFKIAGTLDEVVSNEDIERLHEEIEAAWKEVGVL